MSGYLVRKLYDVVKDVLPMNWEDTEESSVVVLDKTGGGDTVTGEEYESSGKPLKGQVSLLEPVRRNKSSARAQKVLYDIYKDNKLLEANMYMSNTKKSIKSAVGGCITENTGILVSSLPRNKRRSTNTTNSSSSSSSSSISSMSTSSNTSDMSIHLISKQKVITRADLINFNKRKYNLQSEFAILDK